MSEKVDRRGGRSRLFVWLGVVALFCVLGWIVKTSILHPVEVKAGAAFVRHVCNVAAKIDSPSCGSLGEHRDAWGRLVECRQQGDAGLEFVTFGADGLPGGVAENTDRGCAMKNRKCHCWSGGPRSDSALPSSRSPNEAF